MSSDKFSKLKSNKNNPSIIVNYAKKFEYVSNI